MPRTLNPEIVTLTIENQDNDIKDQFTRSLIADEEAGTIASRKYDPNEYFIGSDRYLYETLAEIQTGATFVPDLNVKSGVKIANEISSLKRGLANLQIDVAPIENGTNYSTSYVKGEQFLRNGLLYEVTANNVSSSTEIDTQTNGNAKLADCVTKQLNDLYNDTHSISTTTMSLYSSFSAGLTFGLTKIGRLVICSLNAMKVPAGEGTLGPICDIPDGYKPVEQERITVYGTNGSQFYMFTAHPSGNIYFSSYGGNSVAVENIGGQIVWFTS